MSERQRVLILGADGFIGRHIAFAMRAAGLHVIAHARAPLRLAAMGFDTIKADLCNPKTHDPKFWESILSTDTWLVNAAGLLNGSKAQFQAVHVDAPAAIYKCLGSNARAVLISAIGIEADTDFGKFRRAGEAIATDQVTILRPGLVMGDTSYGGSSLARSLAALPLVTPVVGDGQQRFNPIHATDLAEIILECLKAPPPQEPHTVGGPEVVTQQGLMTLLRGWLGLREQRVLKLPVRFAMVMGGLGDALRLGPISRQAVAQLEHGVLAPMSAHIKSTPRSVSAFVQTRPAGTQDLWHARLYLTRPLVRLTLAFLWIASGILGLTLPSETFLPLILNGPLPDAAMVAMARIGGLADLVIALALLRNWRPRLMAWAQFTLIATYTITFTFLAPILWLLPLGGLLKNIPILVLVLIWSILEQER